MLSVDVDYSSRQASMHGVRHRTAEVWCSVVSAILMNEPARSELRAKNRLCAAAGSGLLGELMVNHFEGPPDLMLPQNVGNNHVLQTNNHLLAIGTLFDLNPLKLKRRVGV